MDAPRPNYGISRIDQPEKKNHGFYVRITHRGRTFQKYFPDKANGSKTKALKAARLFRDSVVKKLPKTKQRSASAKKRKVKQSGVTGVTHVVSKSGNDATYEYWQAAWVDSAGRRRTAKFSISRYGNNEALELAKKARRKAARAAKAPAKAQPAAKKKTAAKKKAAAKPKAKAAPKKKAAKPKAKAAPKKKAAKPKAKAAPKKKAAKPKAKAAPKKKKPAAKKKKR